VDELTSDFDTAWKQALEWFFEPFLGFFFSATHGEIDWSREPVFLDKELQEIVPEAEAGRGTVDKLVKVWTLEGEEAWVLIHVEVQSQPDAAFAERMFTYHVRIRERYGRMPVSIAVLGDDRPSWRPREFHSGRWGCEVRFAFPAVKLLDWSGRECELEADPNPFAAVVLAHLKTLETRTDPTARYDWKLRLVMGLYDRGYSKLQIRMLFNVLDWVMKLPPPEKLRLRQRVDAYEEENNVELLSPTYQMIRDESLAAGEQKGIQQGNLRAIRLGLKLRFGQAGLDLMPRVQAVTDATVIEAIYDAIETTPDLDAIRNLLPPQA